MNERIQRTTPANFHFNRVLFYSKSMDWFLYDNDLCHERVKEEILNLLSDKTTRIGGIPTKVLWPTK